MQDITFITGNPGKAEQLARHINQVLHKKIDLTEIQSLDVKEIVTHKVKEAYRQIHSPVLVEDTSLEFAALGKLPGTLIKWFLEELGNEGLCRLLDSFSDRSATCYINFAFYDGKTLKIFNSVMKGQIAKEPKGDMGFGWDPIFINEGYAKTRGEMTLEEYDNTSERKVALKKLEKYLHEN